MDRRQKKFQRQMNKGIKLYEKRAHKEYDHYGKINTRKEQYTEEKQKNGCLGCLIGFIKFILVLIIMALFVFIIICFIV